MVPAPARIRSKDPGTATFLVTIRPANPVEPWTSRRVTLLGDAIHTVSPGRGDGANTALRDADLLRRTLAAVAAGAASLPEAKAVYEAEMLRYGFEAVADSRERPFAKPGSHRR